MTKLAIVSDIHAGLGKNDRELRSLQTDAVIQAVKFLQHQEFDTLLLNGDMTDHFGNAFACGTDREIAVEVLYPLVQLMKERRATMYTHHIAGNTDWPLGEGTKEGQELYMEYTGIMPEIANVSMHGPFLHMEPLQDDGRVTIAHGHAFHPGMLNAGHLMPHYDAQRPDEKLRKRLHELSGAHRMDYLKAVAIGSLVRSLSQGMRSGVSSLLGGSYTRKYERNFAGILRKEILLEGKMVGVMGHTHVAGVHEYDGITIINTGTTGAKPNPLQRMSDPRGHLALLDTERETYDLVQTFHAAQPHGKPVSVAKGEF